MNSLFKYGCLLFEGYCFVDDSSDMYYEFNRAIKNCLLHDESLKNNFVDESKKLLGDPLSKHSVLVISNGIPICKFRLFRFRDAFDGMFDCNDIFETRIVVKEFRVKLARRIRRLTSALHHYLFEVNFCNRIYSLVRSKPGVFSGIREKLDYSTDNPTKHFFFEGNKDREFENYMFFVNGFDIDIGGNNYGLLVIDKKKYFEMDLNYYWNMFKEIKS